MKQQETLNVSGHLEIYKVYDDGKEEQVFSEKNTITSGLVQIRYFQLGTKGDTKINSYGVSETSLVSALGQQGFATDYQTTLQTNLPLSLHQLMDWNGAAKNTSEGSTNWYFGIISDNSIKRVDLNSLTYILYIEKDACNDLGAPLNEIGLFMQNPLGLNPHNRSQLVAYRPFMNIAKTDDFALVFKWTLNF